MDDAAEQDKTQTIELFEGLCDACGELVKTPLRHAGAVEVCCFECLLNGQALALTP